MEKLTIGANRQITIDIIRSKEKNREKWTKIIKLTIKLTIMVLV